MCGNKIKFQGEGKKRKKERENERDSYVCLPPDHDI